jgi:voltage-gated potassium channel
MLPFFPHFLKIIRYFKQENIPRLVIITLGILVLGTGGLYFFEHPTNHGVQSIGDAAWWSIVTVTTVGYGDIFPTTPGGRIVAAGVMLVGIGFLGLFTATVASIFVERKLKEERGLKAVKVKDHTIICGWNYRAHDILKEIRAEKTGKTEIVVVIANIESKPVDDDALYLVKGEVTEDNLKRANLAEAQNIIIVADDKLDPRSRDAKTVLNTLTVESINPDVYTCVEIEDSENAPYCRRAHANEIIVSGEFSSKLLARAAMNHGISKLIDELLSSRYGADLFKYKVPPVLVGKRFMDVFFEAKDKYDCTIVAIESEPDHTFISNPAKDYIIQANDSLILISSHVPAFV